MMTNKVNTTSTPYTLEEIEHSFSIMEEYVIYDENKNITFDLINATQNPHVTQRDIEIAQEFAMHNNELMNAMLVKSVLVK